MDHSAASMSKAVERDGGTDEVAVELPARVTERIEPGHVFTAFHFPEIRTNLLIGPSADVNTSCPEYKVVAVDVRPVAEEPRRTPAIAAAG